jgi:hypothetical protein
MKTWMSESSVNHIRFEGRRGQPVPAIIVIDAANVSGMRRNAGNLMYDDGMPISITPPPGEDELECAQCGAYFYYELTRCPNCGVNIYEPDPEDDAYQDEDDDDQSFWG